MGLDRKVARYVRNYAEKQSSATVDELCEMARPGHIYDVQKLIDNDLKKSVQSVVSRIRDGEGRRKSLSDNKGVYINVELTRDLVALKRVRTGLDKLYSGVSKSRKKVKLSEKAVKDQLSLFDMEPYSEKEIMIQTGVAHFNSTT